ncbi:MAG: phosphoglycerate mutase [candidate division Zixibacteria bacterium SM23_81]|nr:MAG: phosphoglycerate mutase [candidate division Zixibacteria bacterium SM23_81]
MDHLKILKSLAIPAESKIVLLVLDGVGGLPDKTSGRTELETASTPNLDELAKKSSCGLMDPISMGLTPGSGPSHLALFGYDPLKYQVGRGVLEAFGIGFELGPSDVAARINFATIDDEGLITDRRAGRISTEENERLCTLLKDIRMPALEIFLRPVKEHRAVVVFRGQNLSGALTDTDPQQLGVPPKEVQPLTPEGHGTAKIVEEFIAEAKKRLAVEHPANMILMRGFDRYEPPPSLQELYLLKSAAIAMYPMYKGVAKLVGMEVIGEATSIAEEFAVLTERFSDYDFFFLHVKQTDSAGEDGDFRRKVAVIEEVDGLLPQLTALKPDVIVVTCDHSTPAVLRSHSWHAAPVLLYSKYCRPDGIETFTERECAKGCLGRFPTRNLMALALANALRLTKYGA